MYLKYWLFTSNFSLLRNVNSVSISVDDILYHIIPSSEYTLCFPYLDTRDLMNFSATSIFSLLIGKFQAQNFVLVLYKTITKNAGFQLGYQFIYYKYCYSFPFVNRILSKSLNPVPDKHATPLLFSKYY